MKTDYNKLAKDIVERIGGVENVMSLTHCITRLRFRLKDESKTKTAQIEQLRGVVSVIQAGGQYQVVIGNEVDDVYEALGKIKGINLEGAVEIDEHDNTAKKKKNPMTTLMETISGIFMPCMPAMVAAGILKALVIMLPMFGLLSEESSTYSILYAIGDSFYYFMPVFLGASAAKKFGTNIYLGIAVAVAFLYPDLLSLYESGAAVTFLGIPVSLMDYSNTVIPIIFAVYFLTKIEKVMKRIIPKIVAGVFVPAFSLLITVPVSLMLIGPVTNWLSEGLSSAISTLVAICPPLVGFIVGGLWSVLIMFGLHWAIMTVAINNFVTIGVDYILPITFPCTFSHAGASLGVALRTKNVKMKEISTAAFFSAFVGAISEPAIYGVNLKYKKPFIIVCIVDAIAGAIIATAGGGITSGVSVSLFTLPVVATWPAGIVSLLCIALGFFGSAIATYFFGVDDKMLEQGQKIDEAAATAAVSEKTDEAATTAAVPEKTNEAALCETAVPEKEADLKDCVIKAPVGGEYIELCDVKDETFSKELLGKGGAVKSSSGTICAPCSGTVCSVHPHAVGIVSDEGAKILVHFGIDTVKLNGKYLEAKVRSGDKIQVGDVLIEADLKAVEAAGYDTTTIVLVTNSEEYAIVAPVRKKKFTVGEGILNCTV